MDDENENNSISKFMRKFYQKKTKILNQIRSHHRQIIDKVHNKSYQRVIQEIIYDLINNSSNLSNFSNFKILKCMMEDPNVRLSENELYDLLIELTIFIKDPYEYTRDDLLEFESRIITIISVLEYIIFNIEMFNLGADFYKVISNQLDNSISSYKKYSSFVSWATSLNHYIPNEESIQKYNLKFFLEYIFSILKILDEDHSQFRKVNLQVDYFLKVLLRSFEHSGVTSAKIPLNQSWERLRNICDFGDSVSPFFTDYYLLKRIKIVIQNWSYKGDKIMISKYGKWLLMEFMWMHADNIHIEEMKYDQRKSSNDEIFTQYQLKNIMFLFGILDIIENYIIESEHLSTLTLVYYFVKEILQKTKSAPIQIKSTVILLKLYFKDATFFKIIDQDFERHFQDKDDVEDTTISSTCFKTFLSAIKPRLYQESLSNHDTILFNNLRGTILLPQTQMQNKRNTLGADKYDELSNKNMIEMIADEMTCSISLEPSEYLCILECEHVISYESFLNLSLVSRCRCPQCRKNIKNYECIFLPLHNIHSYFYIHFVSFGIIGTPPILAVEATRSHYFPAPLLTLTSPSYLDPQLQDQGSNIYNDLSKSWWPIKMRKKSHPAYNWALKALNNRQYEETVLWLTCLLQHYPNSYSTRCDRAFINSFLLHKDYLALKDLNIALGLKSKSPHVLNLRGEVFRRIGYYDEALLDLNKALQLAPNNAISYGIRGALFYEMKRYNESLKDLNYSLQQLQSNGFCLGILGATLVKFGLNDDALSNFNKALEVNPEDVFVLIKRAKLYHELFLNNSGLIDIKKALSINPCNHKALLIRGKIRSTLFKIYSDESLSDINKSLEMKPNNVNALKIRAELYHKLNRNEEALNDLSKAWNLTPNDNSILELRGEIYQSLCCFEEAIHDFNQILQRDPHNIFALSYRGATKYDQELYEEALIDLNKALELRQEDNLCLLKIRAKIYVALGRYHEALMDQNKILDNEPNNNLVILERREVYNKLGLHDHKTCFNPAFQSRSRVTLKSNYSY